MKDLRRIGNLFERKAQRILEEEGYNLIQHTSSINPVSPYDFIVEKEGIKYYIEVRGRSTKKAEDYFNISKRKIELLKHYENVKILLINLVTYKFYDLSQLDKLSLNFALKKVRKNIEDMRSLKVDEEIWKRLMTLRIDFNFKNISKLIERLLELVDESRLKENDR